MSSIGPAEESARRFSRAFSACERNRPFCCAWVIAWNLLYGSMFGWTIVTGSWSCASMASAYCLPTNPEMMSGAAKTVMMPPAAAALAFPFHPDTLPSDMLTNSPKRPRLHAHIQREPPSAPVNSYHCIAHVVRAKELPSTSHGHEISASK